MQPAKQAAERDPRASASDDTVDSAIRSPTLIMIVLRPPLGLPTTPAAYHGNGPTRVANSSSTHPQHGSRPLSRIPPPLASSMYVDLGGAVQTRALRMGGVGGGKARCTSPRDPCHLALAHEAHMSCRALADPEHCGPRPLQRGDQHLGTALPRRLPPVSILLNEPTPAASQQCHLCRGRRGSGPCRMSSRRASCSRCMP